MQVVRIEAKNLEWRAFPAEGEWVATCQMLGVTATGRTWADMVSTMNEILAHLFGDLWRNGELPKFLLDRGWLAHGQIPAPEFGAAPVFDVPAQVSLA